MNGVLVPRQLKGVLEQHWNDKKALFVLGPRQTGKTTLLNEICTEKGEFLFFNCDDPDSNTELITPLNFDKFVS